MRLIAFIEITVLWRFCSFFPTPVHVWCFPFPRLTHCLGPILRIAPNEMHIKDVEYHNTLYALGVKRNKVPYIIDIFGTTLAGRSIPAYV